MLRKLIEKIQIWAAKRKGVDIGAQGEQLACMFLERRGYKILDRNVKAPMGEADVLAEAPGGTIVLVEVKTRIVDPTKPAPKAEDQVGPGKQKKLLALMQHLSRANGWQQRKKRVDVVAIDVPKTGAEPRIKHIVDAVRS
ncbi:YraN family protein [Synechococcus sp. Cruz CV-v-12]|uniref:YraN family protein n=1 Tax=Synechococcus sp. Cruz CV-v-12 TaxID=2823728 RepID=UPI0020CDBB86|nr:YraN family protein [Synechococcus sp. Cruz CV-v-12]MCP9874715.1 YraN family protein [Synechococcus sp. Cruz CV-v-12]